MDIAERLTLSLNVYAKKEGLEYEKLKLGIEIFIINISKIFLMILVASSVGTIKGTFTIFFAFGMLRTYSFGLHANTSLKCTIVSLIIFVFTPYIIHLQELYVTNSLICIAFIFIIFLLYKYAPADTEARPILGTENRRRLKNNSLTIALFIFTLCFLIQDAEIKTLLFFGMVFQTVSILPITYKILKRRLNNYENFE